MNKTIAVIFLLCAFSLRAGDFGDNGDGTVTAQISGLRWQKCSVGQVWNGNSGGCDGSARAMVWQQALNTCNTLELGETGFANRTHWRLPNFNELKSLTRTDVYNPAIDSRAFPATPSSTFWTSSSYAYGPSYAWVVNFNDGDDNNTYKYYAFHVRCVSSGP